MRFPRSAGVLLHPSSFPGPDGIGDLGPSAFRFVDWLALARHSLWQLLPLGPVGPGNSPYASLSSFAGNSLLISLEMLEEDGLLDSAELAEDRKTFSEHEVRYDIVAPYKVAQLQAAFKRFKQRASREEWQAFEAFCQLESEWLVDFALFRALKERFGGCAWYAWPEPIRDRDSDALAAYSDELADQISFHLWSQFIFRRQWTALKQYANEKSIRIIGDIPIYVAHDSADVWSNQELFRLGNAQTPGAVAGVPPDLFSENGQLWGNPMYDWTRMEQDNFAWWRKRVAATLAMVDIIRVDHFRGFAAGWVVPAQALTAREGRWEKGPGRAVFDAIWSGVGDVPFIVEDLGLITDDVNQLREDLDLPGLKVLQFAFGGEPGNPYLPHSYERDTVVYPGTHDNQTSIGWFESLDDRTRTNVQSYIGTEAADISWDLMRLAYASVANTAIVTLQDILRLDDQARMNTPGTGIGNWEWRYRDYQLHDGTAEGLAEFAATYGRVVEVIQQRGFDPFDYTAPDSNQQLFRPSDPFEG